MNSQSALNKGGGKKKVLSTRQVPEWKKKTNNKIQICNSKKSINYNKLKTGCARWSLSIWGLCSTAK